jgi:large subunit ribosomal protein L34
LSGPQTSSSTHRHQLLVSSTMMSFLSSRVAVAAPHMMLRRPLLMMNRPRTMTTLTLSPPPFAAQSMFSALMPSFTPPLRAGLQQSLESLLSWSTWLIKRTFQPSIIRKRRKGGLLTRNKSVGGRKILQRRKKKGRARLAGC